MEKEEDNWVELYVSLHLLAAKMEGGDEQRLQIFGQRLLKSRHRHSAAYDIYSDDRKRKVGRFLNTDLSQLLAW
jgi:hypothetical protein